MNKDLREFMEEMSNDHRQKLIDHLLYENELLKETIRDVTKVVERMKEDLERAEVTNGFREV